jgi:3-phenylpropionate/trans-cinnamate dioxygenase ferredoxin reductase subunit
LSIPGLERAGRLSNLHYLRTLRDAKRIRSQLQAGFRLVIVGGGYIGLEVAAVARRHGLQVTLLEALPRVLARVTAPELSDFYAAVHRRAGVDIRTGTAIRSATLDASGDAVASVTTAQGDLLPTDVLVIGVGILPNVELAERCGLAAENGIIVDGLNRTADPDILAIGDCCNQPSALYDRRVRIESVPNALGQARAAAATLCGRGQTYAAVPWFWSDQYDLKLQIVGLSQGYDSLVLRGRPEDHSFIAFYLMAGRIIAADAVNRPKEFMQAKRLVTERACIPAGRLADESASLL